MCGIAGFAGHVGHPESVLRRMCEVLIHRGPDDERFHIESGHVGLGFRRLSIIDLVHGAQPIWNEAHTVAVTCNGEIYNFKELRERLSSGGHTFATGSDVETIVHLYEVHGLRFVDHLQGMFAIALWDAARRRLVLARDRMGVKPLYWAELDAGIAYASEPGSLIASGLVNAAADGAAIAQYLTLQYVPAPRSGFVGVRKLAPAQMLVFESGGYSIETYWRLRHEPKLVPTDEEAVDRLDELLRDATRGRLIADVPLGAFLSGGIDSSVVVSYMAELSSRVRTFSIDFPMRSYSEAAYARRVAEIYGTEHEEHLVDPSIVPIAADVVGHAGEPFADSSAIPTFLLSEMTRRSVTVALSGDGGDEAFGGYQRYQVARAGDRLGPATMLLKPLPRLIGIGHPRRWRGRAIRALEALTLSRHDRYASIVAHFTPAQLDALCTPEFLSAAGGSRAAWDQTLALPPLAGVDPYVALDVGSYLPGDLLLKVDRMSMAHSLEVRSPLLDYRVQEFGAALPTFMKLRGRMTKWLLRELATRRGLPHDLVHRRKQGFGIPVGEWMRDELRGWLEDVLFDPQTQSRGYFRRAAVEGLVKDHVEGRRDHTPRLWSLLMLELWHRTWIDDWTHPSVDAMGVRG